jgi:prepilin-type N-terminal cleavage/methylation domain-containing protein
MTTERRRFTGEDGVTLVELLTVMAVSAVVLAFVTGTVIHALRSQRRQRAELAALNEAKVAFERMSRDIRGADPLRVATPDLIRLDVRGPGSDVRTVTYARDRDRLVATDGPTGQSRPLVADLAAGQPLFRFHLADGSTAPDDQALDPRSVRSITIRLQVEPDEAGRVVDLVTRVLVRNAALS